LIDNILINYFFKITAIVKYLIFDDKFSWIVFFDLNNDLFTTTITHEKPNIGDYRQRRESFKVFI